MPDKTIVIPIYGCPPEKEGISEDKIFDHPVVKDPWMIVQCELISRHKKFNSYLMLEDGLALADAGLRKELENIDESVLPLSDTRAILNPFLLDINNAPGPEK